MADSCRSLQGSPLLYRQMSCHCPYCLMPMVAIAFRVEECPLLRAVFADTLGSASPFAGFEGYNCSWGPPTLQPTSRWNDTWGMGWENLFEVEVMEMRAADLTQARLPCFTPARRSYGTGAQSGCG